MMAQRNKDNLAVSFHAFVKSTNLEEVNPLSPGGQPLFRSHDVLVREVTKRLSPAHAQFFAEPEVSETLDSVDWYGSGQNLRKLTSLDGPAQAEARQDVARFFDDITDLATGLETSQDSDERYLSRLLSQALRIPSDDSIFVGSAGPLIVDWGTVARGAPTEYHVLRVLRDRAEAERPPAPQKPTHTPPAGLGRHAGLGPRSGLHPGGPKLRQTGPVQIPNALYIGSLLSTIILASIIMVLLLSSCGVTLPRFLSGFAERTVLSYCEETAHTDTLLDLVASYEREIKEKQQACTAATDDRADVAPAPPVAPGPPPTNGSVVVRAIDPAVGPMCAHAVCASGLSTNSDDAACNAFDQIKDRLMSDIPVGFCRAYIFPIEFTVPAGTAFTAQYDVLANGEPYQTFAVQAETYGQQLLEVLQRSGHPRLYWVADFAWPPKHTTPDTKGAD